MKRIVKKFIGYAVVGGVIFFLCDLIFDHECASVTKYIIQGIVMGIVITLMDYTDRKGWNSWKKLLSVFKRKQRYSFDLKRDKEKVLFIYKGVTYELGDQPYEPCTYIKLDGKIICTLHNAFTVYDLPEFFSEGKTLTAIDGKVYDEVGFCKVIAASIDSGRSEMDFPFAAKLVTD